MRFWFVGNLVPIVDKMFDVTGASKDERLDGILALVRVATTTLLEALEKCEYGLRFKAFTLKKFEGEHAEQQMETLTDTIGAGIIVSLQELDRKVADKWDLDICNAVNEDGDSELWIHAKLHDETPAMLEG